MGRKLTRAEEGPGCDEAAAAAAGTSSATSSTSPPQSPTPTPSSPSPSPSPPQSSTSTPSSTSSADEEDLWGEEQEFDQLQESMSITQCQLLMNCILLYPLIQEDERGEEQEVDLLQESLGTTHLNSTRSEIQDIENDDTGGVSNNRSKLGHKEPVLTLENFNDDIIIGKIMLLSKKYGFFRRIAGDGSCFYRALILNYLENVVEIKDEDKRKTEAARLRQHVERYMLACFDEDLLPAFYDTTHGFQQNRVGIFNTVSEHSSVWGFESVVSLIEQGLSAGELYHMEINEHVTSQILPLLRSLTEIEICTREDYYHAFLIDGEGYESVFELCFCEVRPGNGEANDMQITALANALGIPIVLEYLNGNSPVRLNPHHIYPSRESEAEALELEQSIDSDDSTTPMAQVEHDGSRNLSSAERRRLVTLLYKPGHYDIIYPK